MEKNITPRRQDKSLGWLAIGAAAVLIVIFAAPLVIPGMALLSAWLLLAWGIKVLGFSK